MRLYKEIVLDHEIKSNLYPCAHCSQTGTCASGPDGSSCLVCLKINEVKGKLIFGIICGSCNGIGLAEPRTERINKRIKPVLAIGFMFSLLAGVYVAASLNSAYFHEILVFSTTLLGSIVGYYFSARQSGSQH